MSRVLIATDGSECALSAARRALELFGPGADVSVLTVIDLRPELAAGTGGLLGAEPLAVPLSDPDFLAEEERALDQAARETLDRTVAALGVEADRLVGHGEPASEICRVAGEGNFDVVVVGSHGSGFLKRVVLGSVSTQVMHHAPCPVLVARQRPSKR